MATAARAEELVRRIRTATTAEGHTWLGDKLAALSGSAGMSELSSAFAQTARRVGREPLELPVDVTLQGPLDPVPLSGLTADVAGRVALLMALGEGRPELLADAVDGLYRDGDTREKLAVVRALALLPEQSRFVEIALDAGRTNDTALFRAVACDNPFAARHYPELEFNKLVMKAAFVRAPVDRIVGLERRANPELARMGMEYIDEQESAGRGFVAEIWLAIARAAPPGAAGRMLGYASHSVAAQRLGAVRGLAILGQPRMRSFVVERLEVERDERVRQALLEALASIDRATTT
jgi:hypothetical protein